LITKKLISQIEGEAILDMQLQNDKVAFATIRFEQLRGFETLLEGKPALDALVFTPRVCGICGHSHLYATVKALENIYTNNNIEVALSNKAKLLREITLTQEIIQNHFKWIYLTLLPKLSHLAQEKIPSNKLKGLYPTNFSSKIIALFAGQYPHASYMIPGGITSDPTFVEIHQVRSYMQEIKNFFEKELLGVGLTEFLAFESCKDFAQLSKDLFFIEEMLIKTQMHQKGFGYDRFLVLQDHFFSKSGKYKHTRKLKADPKYLALQPSYSLSEKSVAQNATYKGEYYETGPLARAIAKDHKLLKNIHRRFKDSGYSRVIARIYELAYLIQHSFTLLEELDIFEPSCIELPPIEQLSGTGVGIIEAPRGSLYHKIELKKGIIKSYQIITPTQFNIGSDTPAHPTPAQHSMIGMSKEEAEFLFLGYDVCSVCTTH